MKRTILLALAAFAVIVAAAVAAAPTASIEDVTQTSMKLTKLDCGTNWNIRIRRIRADGTYGATQTLPPTRTLPCSPPPPPPADSDGDGVPDSSDTCPGTPPGTQVDATGCPVNNPPPPPPGDEPAPIAGQGYHQAFRDDFTTLDRSVWDDHIWYDDSPDPTWQNAYGGFQYTDAAGVLHLHTSREFTGSTGQPYPMDTITTQSSGKTWTQGYFEARMKWTGGRGSWPGFWLISYRHATNPAWPNVNPFCAQNGLPAAQCWSAELDAFEGQGADPTTFYGTSHRNSCGCYGVDDSQNDNNSHSAPDLTAGFHTYGMLWTATAITWYLDGQPLMSTPTYDSTNQPMFLLLQMWTGGWTGDPDASTPNDLDTQVDYVSVWQQ